MEVQLRMPDSGRLKFNVYLKRDSMLVELYAINRTPSGLYFNPTRRAGGKTHSSHTYHQDGLSWGKGLVTRNDSKVRDSPLSDFEGQRTLRTSINVIGSTDQGIPETQIVIRPQDIMLDRPRAFGVEFILSSEPIELATLADRPNSITYVKDEVFPLIIIEVYDLTSRAMLSPRFPRLTPLIEGETLFFDHPGHI